MPWPGAAAVTVSLIHLANGRVADNVVVDVLNGRSVPRVNSWLKPTPERADPVPLVSNESKAFVGNFVLGLGFTLTPEKRHELVTENPANAERTFPYLGGEEVNSHPRQSHERFVISFGRMELRDAERWPSLIAHVRSHVKPERDRLKDNADGLRYKRTWWQFGRPADALQANLLGLPRCLVAAIVSKHLMFSFQPANRLFSHKLFAFPFERVTGFAVLQSRVHGPWAWLLSSTMKTDLNYSASDCFETFPFPQPDPRTVIPTLEAIGEKLYTTRAAFMVDTNQGLTKTYNALKDPACDEPRILELRRLHEEMDRTVLDAYGWSDVAVPPFCPLNDADRAALAGFEDEVIDRLYVLNAERAREEERLGLGKKGAKGRKAAAGDGGAGVDGDRDAGGDVDAGDVADGAPAVKKRGSGAAAAKAGAAKKPKKGGAGEGQGGLFS